MDSKNPLRTICGGDKRREPGVFKEYGYAVRRRLNTTARMMTSTAAAATAMTIHRGLTPESGFRFQISGIEDIAAHFFGVGRRGVFHCLRDFIILINTVADGKTFRCQLFLLFFRAFQP